MNAVVIDDEKYCTDVLTILLAKHCPEINVIKVFNQSAIALDYLKSHVVDIIFLDIEMPQMNGFELLYQLGKVSSLVIFTTAYDQYALKAFRFNAIDYLLKPIDKNELIIAVKKTNRFTPLSSENIENLHYLSQHKVPERILLPIGQELILVSVKDIICCEADGSYCKVYCSDMNKPYILSKNLREMEEILNNSGFFRPHTSWLIHDKYVSKIIRGEGMEIVLQGNIHVPVSRAKKQEVIERFSR
jgi:two-component system, LytTR family, response regulator